MLPITDFMWFSKFKVPPNDINRICTLESIFKYSIVPTKT